jgi:hypothetical protein
MIIKLLQNPSPTNIHKLFVRISHTCAAQDFLFNKDYSTDAAYWVAQLQHGHSVSLVDTLSYFWPR